MCIRDSGKSVSLGDMFLSDFIQPRCYATYQILQEAWSRLHRLYWEKPDTVSSLSRAIGLFNIMVKLVWNIVNTKISYRRDSKVFRRADFWQLPNETWTSKSGDCEDITFLLASAVEWLKAGWRESEARVYACIGYYRDRSNRFYGHSFALYRHPKIADRWLWIETTLDHEVELSVWLNWNPQTLIPVYFFNSTEAYRLDRDYEKLGLTRDYVNSHRDIIDRMIEYVETGRRLDISWMHKSTRVPELVW